jgi:hypothetical protein
MSLQFYSQPDSEYLHEETKTHNFIEIITAQFYVIMSGKDNTQQNTHYLSIHIYVFFLL